MMVSDKTEEELAEFSEDELEATIEATQEEEDSVREELYLIEDDVEKLERALRIKRERSE